MEEAPALNRSDGDLLRDDDEGPLVRRARALVGWCTANPIELLLLGVGIALRVAMLRTHPPKSGYDYVEHQATIEWWKEHFRLPPLLLSRGAYHPQLYYLLAGLVRRAGGGWRAVQAISVWCGCLRLGLIAFAGWRYLPSRAARIFLVALAAVMPASVQMDGMVTQEALNNLLATGFVVLLMETCRAPSARRRSWSIALGLVVGLSLLVKVSGFVLLAVLIVAPAIELAQSAGLALGERRARLRSWALALSVAVVTCAGQYIHNRVVYGKAVLDGWYQRPTADTEEVGAKRIPMLDRRTSGYFLDFSSDIFQFPYYPSGLHPKPRFWPVLIASSFCDYYNYRFGPAVDAGSPLIANTRKVGERATQLARASIVGGTVLSIVCAIAWIASFVRLVLRREVARPLALLIPAVGLAGQMFFATQFPYDFEGVVKGVYFHFATLPLYALLGCVFAWLAGSRVLRIAAAGLALAIVPIATYSTYCAFHQ
jgi:hypothetical protein